MDSFDARDLVEDAAVRIDCIADLFGAAGAGELSMSDRGISGFLLILNSISDDLRRAIDATTTHTRRSS